MHELFAPLAAGSVTESAESATHAAAFAPGQLAHSDLSLMLTFPAAVAFSLPQRSSMHERTRTRLLRGIGADTSSRPACRAACALDGVMLAREQEKRRIYIGERRRCESEALPIFGGLSEPSLSVLSDGSPAGVLTV